MGLLRGRGIELPELDAAATAPLDDVLDATAAGWSAHRIARGEAQSLPDLPEFVDGRRGAIWYWARPKGGAGPGSFC
jgi:hypothetical protein